MTKISPKVYIQKNYEILSFFTLTPLNLSINLCKLVSKTKGIVSFVVISVSPKTTHS